MVRVAFIYVLVCVLKLEDTINPVAKAPVLHLSFLKINCT